MVTKAWSVGALLFMFILVSPVRSEAYIIGDEDVLQISVWGNQELSVQVPVRPDGMISAPLLGDVMARGLTPQELKTALERGMSRFVKAPVVSVMVTAVNSFKVYVFGEGISRNPAAVQAAGGTGTSGMLTLRKNTSLLQLLAQLGSLKDADLKNAYLVRGKKKVAADFAALVAMGENAENIQLAADDVIYIPAGFDQRIRIIGAVRTPMTISYADGMTALDAVLSAGGFTEFASQNGVTVVRNEAGTVRSIDVKLKDVMNGNVKKNVALQPGDIVMVHSGIF